MSYLAGLFGPSQSLNDPGHWLIRAIGGGRTHAGTTVSEYSAMQFSAVYNAVGLIADSLAQLPLGVYKKTDNGNVLDENHRLMPVLRRRPNKYMSSFTWRQCGQHHALLWGNSYTEIQRNNAGQAIALWPLLPDRTGPQYNPDKDDLVYYTTVAGERVPIDQQNVAHIKAIGFDGYIGYPPLTMMRQAVGLASGMEEFGGKFFANDAKSGGFLLHPGRLGAEGQKNLQASMGPEGQGGLDNAHRVKILEEGMKFIQTTIPPDDAQFLGSRSFQVEEIARFFRVPLVLMNSHERTSALGSSVEQLLLAFVLWTLQPWVDQWEEELNEKLFTDEEKRQGYCVRFNMAALQRGDMEARSKLYTALWQIGAISPNEVRLREDMNSDPRLNGFYVPMNFQRVDDQPGEISVPIVSEPAENIHD